jgi:hypothetical protein
MLAGPPAKPMLNRRLAAFLSSSGSCDCRIRDPPAEPVTTLKQEVVMRIKALVTTLALVGMSLISPLQAEAQRQDVGQATFGNLIAALNNINAQVRALENVDINEIRVVSADNLARGANVQALNNAVNRNNVEILNLRNVLNNSLNDNEVLRNALQNALQNAEILTEPNVFVSRVVAIEVLRTGDVIVFYR